MGKVRIRRRTSKLYKDGCRIIHEVEDARGNKGWLVHDPETGGSKYIWDKGHVWAGFEVENLRIL